MLSVCHLMEHWSVCMCDLISNQWSVFAHLVLNHWSQVVCVNQILNHWSMCAEFQNYLVCVNRMPFYADKFPIIISRTISPSLGSCLLEMKKFIRIQ